MDSPPDPATPRSVLRRFGLLQAAALNMANMVGVGPFLTIPLLLSAMHGPQGMIGWGLALVITLTDGMVWAELGAAMPGSGGSYVYLREGFGRETFGLLMAFLFIWQFIISGPLEVASGYVGFSQYLGYLWPEMTWAESVAVAVAVGLLNVALLYRQITSIGKITVSLWIGVLLTVGAVILAGALDSTPPWPSIFPPAPFISASVSSWDSAKPPGSESMTTWVITTSAISARR